MKYIKRLALNRKDQQSNRFAVEADGRIVTTSKVSLQLPSGATSDRPSGIDGEIRYNTSLDDSEIYNASGDGQGWEKIKTNRQGTITPQNLGVGNYLNTIFGPLSYDISISKPQNVMVFVDNVYQIPTTNYTLIPGTSAAVDATTVGDTLSGVTEIVVDSIANILVGQTITSTGGAFANNTVVSDVSTLTNTVTFDLATIGAISSGTTCTFAFQSGTFIEFGGAVPAKQVFVLLGFDGYAP